MNQKDYNFISKNYSNSRIIMSKESEINFTPIPLSKQKNGFKPIGLWYGIGTSWIDWVISNMPDWECENIFEIKLDESKLLKIGNSKVLKDFTFEYSKPLDHIVNTRFTLIDWNLFCATKGGIEINPYQYDDAMLLWYYGWDIACGCVWNLSGVKLKLLTDQGIE